MSDRPITLWNYRHGRMTRSRVIGTKINSVTTPLRLGSGR
jgi:hypothetical protein